nr:hypothetical protein [Tanacetum cinerariifolium]
MSGSEPGEMALESLKHVVILKFDMHVYTSTLTLEELNQAIKEFFIPMDLHPRLPSPDLTMKKLSDDVIVITMDDFLYLPDRNGTFVSKGDSILNNEHPPIRTTASLPVGDVQLEELNHLRSDCLKERQLNDGLSKKLVLLESAHAQSFNKERELFDRLKDMEKDKDEWRHTIAAHKVAVSYLLPPKDLMNVFPDVPVNTGADKTRASIQDGDASSSQPKPQDTTSLDATTRA